MSCGDWGKFGCNAMVIFVVDSVVDSDGNLSLVRTTISAQQVSVGLILVYFAADQIWILEVGTQISVARDQDFHFGDYGQRNNMRII